MINNVIITVLTLYLLSVMNVITPSTTLDQLPLAWG